MADRKDLVVDAGPLYAIADASDRMHRDCMKLLGSHRGPLIVPTLVTTEVAYLLGRRLGAQAEVLFGHDLASGAFQVDAVHPGDWVRIAGWWRLTGIFRWGRQMPRSSPARSVTTSRNWRPWTVDICRRSDPVMCRRLPCCPVHSQP